MSQTFRLALLLLMASLTVGEARALTLDKVAGWFSARNQCPPLSGRYEDLDKPQLLKRYQETRQDLCEAYELAWTLGEKGESESFKDALTLLMKVKDFRQTAFQALRLENDPQLRKDIYRTFLLRAVAAAALELGPGRDPQWLYLILGKPARVAEVNSLARFVAIDNFFEDYPNSTLTSEVKNLRETVVRLLLQREFSIAEELAKRDQFLAAILRLEALYRDDMIDESQHLPEVVVRVIGYQLKLARAIEKTPSGVGAVVDQLYQKLSPDDHYRPYKWYNDRLRANFRIDSSQSLDRNAIATQLRQKALQTAAVLREKFPNHPATLSLKN